MKMIFRYAICALMILAIAHRGRAQTMSPEAMVGQILATHIGPSGLPSDFLIQGQVTDAIGTRSLRMQVKGKDKIRYEQTQSGQTLVSIFNAGTAWAGATTGLKPLMEHASARRPIELPFLDVIGELGNPYWKVRYIGEEAAGGGTVLHFAVHFTDPVPSQKRFLRRALNEDVDFFVDARTNLIVRSQRLQMANDSMDFRVPSLLDFSDYRQVNGMMIPFRIVNTIGNRNAGIRQITMVLQSVLINQGIPDSAFRPQ